jgi:hypothetical protein
MSTRDGYQTAILSRHQLTRNRGQIFLRFYFTFQTGQSFSGNVMNKEATRDPTGSAGPINAHLGLCRWWIVTWIKPPDSSSKSQVTFVRRVAFSVDYDGESAAADLWGRFETQKNPDWFSERQKRSPRCRAVNGAETDLSNQGDPPPFGQASISEGSARVTTSAGSCCSSDRTRFCYVYLRNGTLNVVRLRQMRSIVIEDRVQRDSQPDRIKGLPA